jgi:hypothetical protein
MVCKFAEKIRDESMVSYIPLKNIPLNDYSTIGYSKIDFDVYKSQRKNRRDFLYYVQFWCQLRP